MSDTSPFHIWTSSSEGSRGPAAGGGAGGWWCACFRSSPGKSAASRTGFAAPSTGLSCANTGSSCAAGGWGTGPRRALMVSTRVGMDGLETTGAGHGAIAIPTSPGLAQDGGLGAGPQRGTPGPAARRSRRRARRSGLLGSATRPRHVLRPPLSPAPPQRSLAPSLAPSPEPLPPPPSSTSKLRGRVPAPQLLPSLLLSTAPQSFCFHSQILPPASRTHGS